MPAEGGADRILTVPNALSTIRLACIPVFVVLVQAPHRRHWLAAAILLGALGATDWLDGFLARRLGQVSTLGQVLDPTADRLLLVTAAVSTAAVGALPLAVAALALGRELIVALGFVAVAAAGGRRMEVHLVGKAGAFGMMCALPLFLAGHAPLSWHAGAEVAAWCFTVPGLVLAWASLLVYGPTARRVLTEARLHHGSAM